jgi:vitellogenic carboxypeptidase-like protein
MRPFVGFLVGTLVLAFASATAPAGHVRVTPLLEAGRAKDVRNLTEISYRGTSFGYAGHYTVPAEHNAERDNHIYTWFQPCRDCDDSDDAPVILWLQGGPGGPGWFGAFAEIGNWYIGGNTTDAEPHPRCFSWCSQNNCLFVDQPVNTGFSYQTDRNTGKPITDVSQVDYTGTSRSAMAQVLSVLTQFYQAFPELADNEFTITGESYGGLYTANLGYLIMEHNKIAPANERINFKSLAVGDPCIDWKAQMPTYPDTLYGMGVIMLDERADLAARFAESLKTIDTDCPTAFHAWNQIWDDNGGLAPSKGRGLYATMTGSRNTADVLMGNSPVPFEYMGQFFARPEAAKAFRVAGVPKPSDGGQNGLNIYNAFVQTGDWCSNSSWAYAQLLLHSEIDLMIYSSTSDPILGPPTTEAGVYSILADAAAADPVKGGRMKSLFQKQRKDIWFVHSESDMDPAGYAKCISTGKDGRRFCYTVVRNAGHEMPAYQPRSGYDMVSRFMESRPWDKSGERPVPTCPQCSGVGPFSGSAEPACHATNW